MLMISRGEVSFPAKRFSSPRPTEVGIFDTMNAPAAKKSAVLLRGNFRLSATSGSMAMSDLHDLRVADEKENNLDLHLGPVLFHCPSFY